jgi:hypothetical protein
MREYLQHHTANLKEKHDEVRTTSRICADKHCAPLKCTEHAGGVVLGKELSAVANFSEYHRSGGLVASKSLYMTHLRHWLKFFPRKQFFIINLATLLKNTTDSVQRLTHFLGVPEFVVPRGRHIALPHENSARVNTVLDCAVQNALHPYYEDQSLELIDFMQKDRNATFEPPFPPFDLPKCVES